MNQDPEQRTDEDKARVAAAYLEIERTGASVGIAGQWAVERKNAIGCSFADALEDAATILKSGKLLGAFDCPPPGPSGPAAH